MHFCHWWTAILTNTVWLVTNAVKEPWWIPGGMGWKQKGIAIGCSNTVVASPFPWPITLRAWVASSLPTSTSMDAHNRSKNRIPNQHLWNPVTCSSRRSFLLLCFLLTRVPPPREGNHDMQQIYFSCPLFFWWDCNIHTNLFWTNSNVRATQCEGWTFSVKWIIVKIHAARRV